MTTKRLTYTKDPLSYGGLKQLDSTVNLDHCRKLEHTSPTKQTQFKRVQENEKKKPNFLIQQSIICPAIQTRWIFMEIR